ncbi:GNAT family N-acetyltransferase [Thalassobellus sediminis]|uniref:GNAT family N-acetyltransferase n=1 Tax=Thalassobellus sediminis TaxID=3367753 RepID=UPI0037AB0E20
MVNYILNKENFYTDLFENDKISNAIKYVSISNSNNIIYKSEKNLIFENKINSIQLVPSYLKIHIDKKLKSKTVFQKKGYAVNLSGYEDIGQYLKANCSSSTKKNTIRSIKKLETCFSIRYKIFYGSIDFETYSFIMKSLLKMLIKRFEQRTGRNRAIENWDYYLSKCYNLILNKKASLFVIFNNNQPIKITLNFYYNCIVYSAISSYDTDFHKFSLGNIDTYKQLEWCLTNKFSIFDLGYGDFNQKKTWCNSIYSFENHVVSTFSKQILAKVYTFFISYKYKFINYLITKNINTIFSEYKSMFTFKKKKIIKDIVHYETETILKEHINYKQLIKINFSSKEYNCLKENVYNFIYKNNEHIDNVTTYKFKNLINCYIIEGKKSANKITSNKH